MLFSKFHIDYSKFKIIITFYVSMNSWDRLPINWKYKNYIFDGFSKSGNHLHHHNILTKYAQRKFKRIGRWHKQQIILHFAKQIKSLVSKSNSSRIGRKGIIKEKNSYIMLSDNIYHPNYKIGYYRFYNKNIPRHPTEGTSRV